MGGEVTATLGKAIYSYFCSLTVYKIDFKNISHYRLSPLVIQIYYQVRTMILLWSWLSGETQFQPSPEVRESGLGM